MSRPHPTHPDCLLDSKALKASCALYYYIRRVCHFTIHSVSPHCTGGNTFRPTERDCRSILCSIQQFVHGESNIPHMDKFDADCKTYDKIQKNLRRIFHPDCMSSHPKTDYRTHFLASYQSVLIVNLLAKGAGIQNAPYLFPHLDTSISGTNNVRYVPRPSAPSDDSDDAGASTPFWISTFQDMPGADHRNNLKDNRGRLTETCPSLPLFHRLRSHRLSRY